MAGCGLRAEQGEGVLGVDASVGAAVTERFLEGFDEALVGGVALGIFGDSKNTLDHPDGLLLESAMADAVKQIEDGLHAFCAGELLDAAFQVDAIHEESGESANRGFSHAVVVFLLEEFDQRCDCVGSDETEGGVAVADAPMHVALVRHVMAHDFGRKQAQAEEGAPAVGICLHWVAKSEKVSSFGEELEA